MSERVSAVGVTCFFTLAVSKAIAPHWELPTPRDIETSLESCTKLNDNAGALRCLVKDIGLWTDEQGYNAKRIAKIFASHNQIEELMLVVNYCNRREQRTDDLNKWAYKAYKCATSGRFGHWVNEYMKQEMETK
ncbi:Odorant-binding protein 99d [Drosophila willistoni]|uniref:Odorant-binding protein 99d n=1 Tax=Drosophila willistoni TaxID=7260 RepID=B4NBK0_DROWI|nr:Odorant-binding protein 99d [Drosophila willistoni]